MNAKTKNSRRLFKKTMKIASIAIFTLALIINVKITLNDPFAIVSKQAMATDDGTNPGCDVEGTDTAGPFGKDEKEETKTFNQGDVLYFGKTTDASGEVSYSVGGGASLPTQYGEVGAQATGSTSYSDYSGTINTEYQTVEEEREYHRWGCSDSWGSCLNEGAGSAWSKTTDPLPTKAGFFDSDYDENCNDHS